MFFKELFAASYELKNGSCYVDDVLQTSTQPCDDALKGVFGILGAILIPLLLIGLVLFVFWILALVHALQHQDIQNRGVWLAVLLVSFFIGLVWLAGPVYYFAVMRPYKNGGARAGSTPNPATAQQNPAVPPTANQPTEPQVSESSDQNNPPNPTV